LNPSPLKATAFKFDAPVNSATFTLDGDAFAFGLGDGSVHIVRGSERKTVKAHSGAVPALRAYDDGFISLSDDGTLKIIRIDGNIKDFADFKGAWTERMAVHDNGSVAVAVGKNVHLWTKREASPRILGPHDGSVTDICFAPDGLGLAASHRDGVTLWAWPHFEPKPMHLAWKGAHLAVTMSADKKWIVSAMQEGALHMWNLALKRDYQMSGYWTKPTRMAWSADRKWLGTSGSESVIIWPFDKQGPEGREALQLGWSNTTFVTAVASHSEEPVMAAGFEDGAVVLIDLANKKAFNAAAPSGHAVTVIMFSPMGTAFIAGTAQGGGVVFDFDS
jgi:WD40 repeat protein